MLTFGTIWDARSQDSHRTVQISTRVSLANVSTKGAATLITLEVEPQNLWVIEGEVVVAVPVLAKVRVILERGQVNRGALIEKICQRALSH